MPSNPTSPAFFNPLRRFQTLAGVLLALLAVSTVAMVQRALAGPVRIFIMAGQSNMLGKGTVSGETTPGTLDHTVANDPDGKYQFLKSGGSYVVRDDVWIRDQDPVWGGLTTGFGGEAAGLIGPELGFGHQMGDVNENPVLIVKCAWGGRDLAFNFCPPSSRIGEPEPVNSADKGFYYTEILRLVGEATSGLASYVPGYAGEGYEIAGVCWHQGWNDRIDTARSAAYETNMANFINDLRSDLSNDFSAPANLPFVIATTGMDGLDGYGYTQVEKAQLIMADASAYPAFAGNVAVVDTRGTYEDLDFWQRVSDSPANENYHWNRNAKTYLHIGLATGDAMSLLAPGRCPYRPRASGGSGGVTLTWQNGTETPTSVRVLRNGSEIAASAPAGSASFLDTTAPLGVNDYELQFTMPGSACDPLTFSHNSGITSLQASQRINGIRLSWNNNLGYTAIQVKRNGGVIAASLPGTATSYVDPSAPTGLVTYTVEPTDTGSTPDEVQVNVSGAPPGTSVIYEPFDMTPSATLSGNHGGIGIDGEWVAGSTVEVASGSLTFGSGPGSLPVFGNRIVRTSGNGSCSINLGTTLAEAGLLDDGAELWFSFLCPNPDNINVSPTLVLGDESLSNATTVAQSGNAIGARLNQGKTVQGVIYSGGGAAATSATQTTLGTSELALVVGHITWGTNPTAADTIEIHTPGTDLVLDTPQSASGVVDQSTFHVLSMWGNVTSPTFDEIRFGATYDDVIGQGIDTSDDFTPPTPATMSFASPPAAVSDSSIIMTAATASDANGVQYRFHNTTLDTYSPWQDSPLFTDTGLSASTSYSYTVQARDKSINQNTNNTSPAASATTNTADTTPPPTPGFASGPTALSATEITMTSTVVIDPDGASVEYRFHNTTLDTYSPWQTDVTFTDTGLTPDTAYAYTVQARDTASTPNKSAPSPSSSATTLGATDGTWDFDADGNWSDASKWASNEVATGSGATATFPDIFSATRSINVDAPITIGHLAFEDTNTQLNVNGTNALVLDVGTGTPSISVSSFRLYINCPILGTDGLAKDGNGYLSLGSSPANYTGTTYVNAGILDLGNLNMANIGGGSGRNISVAEGGIIQRTWGALDNPFLNRLVETNSEIGVFLTATGGSYNPNNLDFSSGGTGADLPNAFLGTWASNGAKSQYDGIITPASDAYRLGHPAQGGSLHIRKAQGDVGTPKGLIVGGGAVILAGDNTFSGDTVIRAGRLFLGRQLCLQNSALNVGNGSDGISGQICFLSSNSGGVSTAELTDQPTLGGLIGSRNLGSIYNSANQNNTARLAIGSVVGITLDVDTGKTHTYSGNARLSTGMYLTKTGQGTQVLSGVNDYTGATSVNEGTLALAGGSHASAITVASGASLDFTLGSPTTSSSSVDLTAGTVKITGAVDNASDYQLMTADLGFTGIPTLDSPIANYALELQNSDTELWLVYAPSGSAYGTWSGGEPADGDLNGDGVSNGVAWALGAAGPSENAIGLLPTLDNTSDATYAIFHFNRSDLANDDLNTAISVQYGSNLAGWNTAVDDGDNVLITETPGSPTDAVEVKFKRSTLGSGGKLFARLNVVVTP